jgi:hypothetical protein
VRTGGEWNWLRTCPVVGFGITDVESSDSILRKLVSFILFIKSILDMPLHTLSCHLSVLHTQCSGCITLIFVLLKLKDTFVHICLYFKFVGCQKY